MVKDLATVFLSPVSKGKCEHTNYPRSFRKSLRVKLDEHKKPKYCINYNLFGYERDLLADEKNTRKNQTSRKVAQGDRNGHGQKGSGGEREIPRAAAGRPVFSLRPHERCDCLPTSPSQESFPSGGQRPLYLPGRRESQGRLCQIPTRGRRLQVREKR